MQILRTIVDFLRLPLAPLSCALVVLLLSGCGVRAPIHFWQPPIVQSAVGKRVAVSKVAGPEEIADRIHERLLASPPNDTGRQLKLVNTEKLQAKTAIQLVSAIDDQTSDVALASVARREGYDYMLRGEVLTQRDYGQKKDSIDRLIMSWRLTSMDNQNPSSGRPVVIDEQFAIERYPDLVLMPDPTDRLVTAAVRETYRLITPSIEREKVPLAVPRWMPGSQAVRRGNAAARTGDWAGAEQIWKQVAEQHPMQSAAVHNLALAAAAAQDFSQAKKLARQAIRQHPTPMYQKTMVWIEQKQRDYHEAFNLPDPPEGWFVTRR
ncbi:tetratricopeptide repeat protein [Novipirellula artificiosorum]|uniref:Uncharacterized protein n=1 Tax=Novipirellula artificiosorum TaxID=2528016 RepID=A0A5C6DD52_9BACT|nr:tetratricopeptide repeat protein [Novipirellula artificiosorum]TWU32839.1 hypothetical protein Poly41_52160 [Novipirellula artificiosorum]